MYEPQYEKMYLLTSTPNEDINQPVSPHSLISAFVVLMNNFYFLNRYPNCASEDSDQTMPLSEGTFYDVNFLKTL